HLPVSNAMQCSLPRSNTQPLMPQWITEFEPNKTRPHARFGWTARTRSHTMAGVLYGVAPDGSSGSHHAVRSGDFHRRIFHGHSGGLFAGRFSSVWPPPALISPGES